LTARIKNFIEIKDIRLAIRSVYKYIVRFV